MASLSAIAAIQTFYGTLTASNFPSGVRPGLYFAEAGQTKFITNDNLVPPYAVLTDHGEAPTPPPGTVETWSVGQSKTIYVGGFSIEFFYTDLGDADSAWWATMWNGSSPLLKLGMAFCQLDMQAPLYSYKYQVIPGRVSRGYAGFEYQNKRVHVTTQEFERRIHLSPT